jgi:hypothetical protein
MLYDRSPPQNECSFGISASVWGAPSVQYTLWLYNMVGALKTIPFPDFIFLRAHWRQ